MEPPASEWAFSTEANGLHYFWGGWAGREKTNTIAVYDVQTEQWALTPTTGPPPPGLWGGGCAIIKNHLYCFGGYDESSWFNDLHKLNLETFQWSEVHPKNSSSEQPVCKANCGLVAVNERTLVCFGGQGSEPAHVQPGSTFTEGIGSVGGTNEFHLFDTQEGVWSSPQVKGERPPPCSGFSLTKVDQDRAVLFGGQLSDGVEVNDLYLFNLRKMEVTKVEPAQGDQLPKPRQGHAACCLNFGEDHPVVVVSGGLCSSCFMAENDMWIHEVDSGEWTKVTPPESRRGRCGHSITATSLGPGLTEVLMFGGQGMLEDSHIAKTTILRFERSLSVTGPPTEKWALVDVAHNNTRGSSQRLREKREKIRQATHLPSSEIKDETGDGVQVLSIPVLPRNRTHVSNGDSNSTEVISSTPPGYPLCQTSAHPKVTFYDMPQERQFPSTGGHADFNNGVEVTVPAKAVPPGSTVGVKVQPGFARSDVFVMPEGIQSASPSYLISSDGSTGLNEEVTVTMEHHVGVSTREEADDLLFLQADPTPDEGHVYRYREVLEGRSEFTPEENKGRLTTRNLSKKFLKIGSKAKKWFKKPKPSASSCPGNPLHPDSPPLNHNLYTVRVYQSPIHTTDDRLAIICVCLSGKLYEQFLDILDNVVIPRDYPEVSTRVADRVVLRLRHFEEPFTALKIPPLLGWTAQPDKEMISKSEVDEPETGNVKPEDLHDYPPRITCHIHPEESAPKRSTCSVTLTGLAPEVKVHIPLRILKPKVTIDTEKLKDATDKLRSTALRVTHPQLGSTVNSIVSLMEKMTDALRSSSLSELAIHTDSLKTEVRSVLTIARKVAEECTRPTISESIAASLSKMEVLSHQLCQVAKVKLRHCQDQLEETAALVDLVESGAGLLRTVDCLLRDMQMLSVVHDPKALTIEALKRRTGVRDVQLDSQIIKKDLPDLAGCFDEVDIYLYKLNLSPAQQTDVKDLAHRQNTTVAMAEALKLWRQPNPFIATFRTLLEIVLDLRRGDVAVSVCQHIMHKVPNC